MKRKQKKSMIMSMIPTVTNKINPADVRNYTGDFADPVKNSHLNFLVIQTETENKLEFFYTPDMIFIKSSASTIRIIGRMIRLPFFITMPAPV